MQSDTHKRNKFGDIRHPRYNSLMLVYLKINITPLTDGKQRPLRKRSATVLDTGGTQSVVTFENYFHLPIHV